MANDSIDGYQKDEILGLWLPKKTVEILATQRKRAQLLIAA